MLDISHSPEDSPWIEDSLSSQGFEGWEVRQEYPQTQFRLYFPLDGTHHDRLQLLKSTLSELGATVSEAGEIRDEDWAENWKEFYHPFQVGERLVIAPSWEEPEPALLGDRELIRLDPGSAFGTGYHETTRLCLETLEGLTSDPRWSEGSLLDYGTGSGILAIGALFLGVSRIDAADRDPVAVKVAGINLRENGFDESRFSLAQADVPTGGPYPFVVANLTADILCQLCQPLVACVEDHLILSGIIETRAAKVLRAFTEAGGRLVNEAHENDWVCYHFRYGSDPS